MQSTEVEIRVWVFFSFLKITFYFYPCIWLWTTCSEKSGDEVKALDSNYGQLKTAAYECWEEQNLFLAMELSLQLQG